MPAAISPLLIPSESPGAIGDPEIWIDESVLDAYVAGRTPAAVALDQPGGSMIGATVKFINFPNLRGRAVYQITVRRRSQHNHGQPYYIARWPD